MTEVKVARVWSQSWSPKLRSQLFKNDLRLEYALYVADKLGFDEVKFFTIVNGKVKEGVDAIEALMYGDGESYISVVPTEEGLQYVENRDFLDSIPYDYDSFQAYIRGRERVLNLIVGKVEGITIPAVASSPRTISTPVPIHEKRLLITVKPVSEDEWVKALFSLPPSRGRWMFRTVVG